MAIDDYTSMSLKKLGSAVEKQRAYKGLSWVVCEISVPLDYTSMSLKKLGSAVEKQRAYKGLSWVVCEISVPLDYTWLLMAIKSMKFYNTAELHSDDVEEREDKTCDHACDRTFPVRPLIENTQNNNREKAGCS